MASKKKLLTYNDIKHPIVEEFFSELEDTHMQSHYMRLAIEFYMQNRNNGNPLNQTSFSNPLPPVQQAVPVEEPKKNTTAAESSSGNDDSEYESFDPTDL